MSMGGLFDGGSPKTKIEPAPTRDTASDAAEQERIRRAAQSGRMSTMLTGPYGVASEPTSGRQLQAGNG